MKFALIHYLRVASHFWPWERAFWLALFHDGLEDGWLPKSAESWFSGDLMVLTRQPGGTYLNYIRACRRMGGDVARVKRADLGENYARAPHSLRKRYVKAMEIMEQSS